MRNYHSIFSFFIGISFFLCFGGCAQKQDDNTTSQEMEITVDFSEVHLCSRISPEMTVAYAPAGTKFYDVRLVELGEMERFLGGGLWPNDGTGTIPEGALSRHYTGPCPPKDKKIEYQYIISALDKEDGQPLAVRFYRFTPE